MRFGIGKNYMNRIALVVVIYGKKLEDSLTIKSLLNFDQAIDHLIIVNNGPKIISQADEVLLVLRNKHKEVFLDNQIKNKPLSWIYNEFISQYDADYYVIFDDDTEINDNYQKNMFEMKDVDIELPKIISMSDGVQYYPLVDGIVQQEIKHVTGAMEIFSIGSGLIISRKIKQYFFEHDIELFDSRFALYGVDFSFFRKINNLLTSGNIFIVSSSTYIDHSLSRTENCGSSWRDRERLYDLVLTLKYYYKYSELRILKLIFKKIINGDFKYILLVVRTFVKGKHPRCVRKRN